MKKVLLFLAIFVFIAYGIIAILLTDFSFGSNLGPSDSEIVLRYIIKDGNGEIVNRQDQTVPMWNNSEGEPVTKSKRTKMLKASDFDMPGYNFNGWYIEGKKYSSGDWVPSGLTGMIVEVHSDWRPKILTVTYDGRLGTTPGRMSVFYGLKYGEAANAISTRTGHTLVGWYTLPDKQGEQIKSDTIVKSAQNIKLYAAWEASGGSVESDSFTINFDANSAAAHGTASIPGLQSSSQLVDPDIQDMKANLPSAISTDARDNFAGWFKTGTLNGTQIRTYEDAQKLLSSGATSVSLIAKWTEVGTPPEEAALKIDFDLGGIGQNNDQGVGITVEGGNVWFNIPMSNDSRYEFVRWTYNGKKVENSNDVRKEGAVAYAIVVAEWKFTPAPVATFAVTFDLNTGTNNPNGSAVTVSTQNYNFRDATKTGSVFMGWYWNGKKYSDAFALKADAGGTGATVVAQWDTVVVPDTYTVTLKNNVDNRTSTITSALGNTNINLPWSFSTHTFNSWRVNGTVVSTNAGFQYNVKNNVEIVAHFDANAPASWTVTLRNTLNSDVATIPNVSGSITINAPSTYFGALNGTFQYWEIGGVILSYNESFTYNVAGNPTLTARYTPKQYTVTLNNNVNGSTSTIPSASGNTQINSPATYFGTLSGTFQYWAVNGVVASYNQSFQYYVSGNVTITAHFQQPAPTTYTVTLRNNINNASATIPNVSGNTTINSPASYFGTLNGTFQHWAVNGSVVNYSQTFTYYVSGNVTITAHFQQTVQTYTVTLNNTLNSSTAHINNASGGTAINSPSSYFGSLNGTFQHWTANGVIVSYTQSFNYNVTGNVTLTAVYQQAVQTSTVTLNNNQNSTTKYIYNASGNTSINSPSSYFGSMSNATFQYWMVNGSIVSYNQTFSYYVSGNVTLTAVYQQAQRYTVTLKNNVNSSTSYIYDASGNTSIKSPTYYFGSLGGTFQYWSVNGSIVSNSLSFSYNVNGNVTLTACYQQATYTVTLKNSINSSSYSLTGCRGDTSIAGPGSYFGSSFANGYTFESWKKGSTVVSYSQSFTYNVTGNVTLTATYSSSQLTIYFCSEVSFSTSHPAITTTNSNVSFPSGNNVRATNGSYTFVRWRLGNPYNGTIVSSTSTTKTACQNQGIYSWCEVWAEWTYSAPTVYTYAIRFKANGGTFPAGNYWGATRSASTSDYTRSGLAASYKLDGYDMFSASNRLSAMKLTRGNVSGKPVGRAAWLVFQVGVLANLDAYNQYDYYNVHTAYNCGYGTGSSLSCSGCHNLTMKQLFERFEVRYPSAVSTSGTTKTITVYATWYYC